MTTTAPRAGLVPKRITDKNGKVTTVWEMPTPSTKSGSATDRLAQRAVPPRSSIVYDDNRLYGSELPSIVDLALADPLGGKPSGKKAKDAGSWLADLLNFFGLRKAAATVQSLNRGKP